MLTLVIHLFVLKIGGFNHFSLFANCVLMFFLCKL
jgi:hypothetical protein